MLFIMFIVYILFSFKLKKYYIGHTNNFNKRFQEHNKGISTFTKSGIPWKIVYSEEYQTRIEAIKREKQIKSYKGGNAFKKMLKGEVAERSIARVC